MQPPLGDEKERCITVTRADDTRRSQRAPALNRLCQRGGRGGGPAGAWRHGEEEYRAQCNEREEEGERGKLEARHFLGFSWISGIF